MISKRYNLINNITGWAVFVIALLTYWLTLEPTASYWDCGEFIIQADKLEVGHPPGNPIFMLTARFFSNFALGPESVSVMVNTMSGLLSALTILLLFWTITHLVRALVIRDGSDKEISLTKYLVIMGSGVVGALAYTWSDTFWFSAVEGEVYAFSSFCTALVFWLILKWENRCDNPGSDRYLILIAYIIGVSIAVHLLNLLCIPAIVLVFAFKKFKNISVSKALLALLVSFVIIALVLFGLVPGFIKMAQQFELLFVNGLHTSFNTGALVYAITMALAFCWAIYELRVQKSAIMIRASFLLMVLLSGMLFMGSGWWIGWVLMAVLAAAMFSKWLNPIPVRILNVIAWSMTVIFVGYSSYALILIRSSADTPMNQNSPDNVFDLAYYLSREQYGETPLLYGETVMSGEQKKFMGMRRDTVMSPDGGMAVLETPVYDRILQKGGPQYAKGVPGAETVSEGGFLNEGELAENRALAERGGDYYVKRDYKSNAKLNPELNMIFPRIYSRMHKDSYSNWISQSLTDTLDGNSKLLYGIDEVSGEKVPELDMYQYPVYNDITGTYTYPQRVGYRPTYGQNLEYFFNYQLNHMYMRYFMWNFAGRQNDVLNQNGELDAGNWISGIPFIDNPRLGDQSMLPDELGKDNPGHNKFYMLPLLLGLIGLIAQAFAGEKGVKQFWVVFFLFFMTGVAIVLYLNQPPMQPRERDYAFAGSFYAFAIWIGMGVMGLWWIIKMILAKRVGKKLPSGNDEQNELLVSDADDDSKNVLKAAIAACALGIIIPIQMVSQTWDDHDRSGRYAARDFAINYLESLEPNAIVFCNGDNDTFPLWYAQEVEGIRPDVKIVNLSYLASDWYANQMRKESYEAAPIDFTATPADIAYGKMDIVLPGDDRSPADLLQSLKLVYSGKLKNDRYGYPQFPTSVVTIPVNKKAVMERGLVSAADTANLVNEIVIDLNNVPAVQSKGFVSLSELLMLDIIATNAANGWPRPIYWCMTVGSEYHFGLSDYMRGVGMVHQLVPTYQTGLPARNDRAYDVVTKKYRWGGADNPNAPYFDETARRMLNSTRMSMIDVASELIYEGDVFRSKGNTEAAADKYRKAVGIADLIVKKLPESTWSFNVHSALTIPGVYTEVGERLGDAKLKKKGETMLLHHIERLLQYVRYNKSIAQQFAGRPVSLTYESAYVPRQIYSFVETYRESGGDMKALDVVLKRNGVKMEELEAYANQGQTPAAEAEEEIPIEQIAGELSGYAKIVNRLATLSAEEYAKESEEDRYIDSAFYYVFSAYIDRMPENLISNDPELSKVDLARSKRILDEYNAKHPAGK